jgi:proteasome lid subunit RPN8/RPN11
VSAAQHFVIIDGRRRADAQSELTMLKALSGLLTRKPRYRVVKRRTKRALLAEYVPAAIQHCIQTEITLGHEGMAYLYGQTNGETTVVLGAIRPEARTTVGSFDVASPAVARVVRKITDAGLQLVGQAHSHPGAAYHSEGDEIGARIAYEGFISIVVPDYGRRLPEVDGWAMFFFRDREFHQLTSADVRGIPKVLS